jgi:hypothetical protein
MSGTIAISPDTRWSASGWLFDWVVGFLAERATDANVAGSLREVVEENLGWLGLGDYGPEADRELREVIRTQLLAAAEERLPGTVPNRAAALDLLRDLTDQVG